MNPQRDEPAQGAVCVSTDRTQCVCRRALRPMWPGQNEGEGWCHQEGSWRVSLATIMALASPQRESVSYTSFSVLAYNPSHLLCNSQHLSSSFPLALLPPWLPSPPQQAMVMSPGKVPSPASSTSTRSPHHSSALIKSP